MELKIGKFDDLTAREIYGIIALREKSFVVKHNWAYQECDGKDLGAYILLCLDNHKVVGTLRILKRGVSCDEVSIGRVAVDEEYRGTGLGKMMMLEAIDFIREVMNEAIIKISSIDYAIGFYEKLGFEVVSDVFLIDKMKHVQMIRRNS